MAGLTGDVWDLDLGGSEMSHKKVSVHSFWNEQRGVYEIWYRGEIIAETTKTDVSLEICKRYSEIAVYKDHYKAARKRFTNIVEAYPRLHPTTGENE